MERKTDYRSSDREFVPKSGHVTIVKPVPQWREAADAWFKLLASIAIAYIILAQAVALLKTFGGITVIAIGGVFLAYLVYPAVAWLHRRMPLSAALTIVYTAGVLVLAGAMYAIVPAAAAQVQGLMRDLPTIERPALAFMHNPSNPFIDHLPGPVRHWILNLPAQFGNELQRSAYAYTSQVINAFVVVGAVAAVLIAIPVVSIYALGESSAIKSFFVGAFEPRTRRRVRLVLHDIDRVITGFVRGQIIVAAVVGILIIIALLVLHVRYAIIIGIWAGATDVIPYIGAAAGAIPAVIVAYVFNGFGSAVGVVIAFIVITQLEAHLLGPRIVSSTVKVSPLTVIFALLIGAKLFGFIGLIIAVPLAGVMRVLLEHIFYQGALTSAKRRRLAASNPRAAVKRPMRTRPERRPPE